MNFIKQLTVMTAIIFILGFKVNVQSEINVYVNDVKINSDPLAQVSSGRTMLPFRAILNSLGVSDNNITWWENSKSVEVNFNEIFIFMSVGVDNAIVNESVIPLDVAPFILSGRTMIPVRFISEVLSANVIWDELKNSVYISR